MCAPAVRPRLYVESFMFKRNRCEIKRNKRPKQILHYIKYIFDYRKRSKILVFSCKQQPSAIYPFISFMAPQKFKFLVISRPFFFFEIKPERTLATLHYLLIVTTTTTCIGSKEKGKRRGVTCGCVGR